MRKPFLAASLVSALAAMLLLVADSAAPCERYEDARADYHFSLTCGEEVTTGTVSFSNLDHTWSFDVESLQFDEPEITEGEEQSEGAAEDSSPVSFVIARVDSDYSDCSPAKGIGVHETAMAEAEVWCEGEQRLFSCKVLEQGGQLETEHCEHGPVLFPNPDGEMPEREGEPYPDCELVLEGISAPAEG